MKHKRIWIGTAAGLLVLAVAVTAVWMVTHRSGGLPTESSESRTAESGIAVPDLMDEATSTTAGTTKAPDLDVKGEPGTAPVTGPSEQRQTTSIPPPTGSNRPSAGVVVKPDGEQSKPEKPNPQPPTTANPYYPANPGDWTPPPPGAGGELISEGWENVPVDIGRDVETDLTDIGLVTGTYLLEAGYSSLYPDAGDPEQMVTDAVREYARTGKVTLRPADYGLPKLIGEYHAKIPAKGNHVAEAARYIASYMMADKAFNDKVQTAFSTYRDGFLGVYQKDGSFYILFAVIDKSYMH